MFSHYVRLLVRTVQAKATDCQCITLEVELRYAGQRNTDCQCITLVNVNNGKSVKEGYNLSLWFEMNSISSKNW
jgi:hypothetical protein